MPLLLGVELLDELYSGVHSVGAADIQAAFGASYTVAAAALLYVPSGLALLIEPVLFVLADRYPRKWFVCGGLFAMAVAAFLAAWAPHIVVLGAAITLAFVGSGAGVALSQATLVDARPSDRERTLTRWALLGEMGDLLAPALMAGLAASTLGFRAAYVIVGAVVLVWALWLARQRFPTSSSASGAGNVPGDSSGGATPTHTAAAGAPDSEDAAADDQTAEPPVWPALLEAVRNRELLFWLGAAALCDLLDEIVVVFATLYLRDHLHAGPLARSVVVGAGVVGAILGVLLAERLLARMPPLRLLLSASVACAISYVAWLLAPTIGWSVVCFFAVGLTAAPMYPLASARAYAALPGRSGTVNAAAHVFTPFTLAAPAVLGVVADGLGVAWALALLLAQPMGLAALACHALRRERRRSGSAGPPLPE